MLSMIAAILAGFVFLMIGAERFVMGASVTAKNMGVSPLIIGLTIVGFGTSAPEMLVSGVASWQGNAGLSIGNALGSNITNIALVLGFTALLVPLKVCSNILKRELPILLLVMIFSFVLVIDGTLGRGDGLMLLIGLGMMIYWMIHMGLKSRQTDPQSGLQGDPLIDEFEHETTPHMSTGKGVMWLVVGMVTLFVSSQALVWGAVGIATLFGVSDLVIGLTIVAIGTSLPELAASVMSAFKGEHDIAIGNIIGSNMFNLLAVLAMPGLMAPGDVMAEALSRDFPLMLGLTVALIVMAYGFRGKDGQINRLEGGILLSVYIAYMYVLYLSFV